ncbi:MAG: hypothetical protein ABW352_01080 [Polyangiales bacterium]
MARASWWLGLGLLLACGEEDGMDVTSGGGRDGGKDTPRAECAPLNSTQRCKCADLNGSQSCSKSGWDECTCVDVKNGGTVTGEDKTPQQGSGTPSGNQRTDINFEWERTEPVTGSCEPGYYEGDFMGLYASQLTFINFPIPVFALGQPGRPGLSFTLQKTGNGETLEIQNGKMDGTANGLFPFTGSLTGTLDCNTLKFNAILSGFYSLGVEGVGMFKFEGPLTGDYDKATRKILNGKWDVKEYDPPPVMDSAGGFGDWQAGWLPP